MILACISRPQLVRTYEASAAEAAAGGLGASWTEFRSRLTEIRKEGFYWSRGELEELVSGAAVPIFNTDGEVAAALALVGRSESLENAGERRLKSWLMRAKEDIEGRIAQGTPPHPSLPAPRTIAKPCKKGLRRQVAVVP